MPDFGDPLVRDAITTALAGAKAMRDCLEEDLVRLDKLIAVLDGLDDLAAVRLRAVR